MSCNGICAFCSTPCFRGVVEVKTEVKKKVAVEEKPVSETGLAVVENVGTYEVVKSVFGKEKVRRVK
jgi:tRNA A37 methylthiotransferase MiaB